MLLKAVVNTQLKFVFKIWMTILLNNSELLLIENNLKHLRSCNKAEYLMLNHLMFGFRLVIVV